MRSNFDEEIMFKTIDIIDINRILLNEKLFT